MKPSSEGPSITPRSPDLQPYGIYSYQHNKLLSEVETAHT